MKKKILLAGIALGGVALSGTALAYQGDNAMRGGEMNTEHREVKQQIMENKDYDGWKIMVEEKHQASVEQHTQVMDAINSQEDFDKMTQIHELMRDGKGEEAQALREELGLPEMKMMGNKKMRKHCRGQFEEQKTK